MKKSCKTIYLIQGSPDICDTHMSHPTILTRASPIALANNLVNMRIATLTLIFGAALADTSSYVMLKHTNVNEVCSLSPNLQSEPLSSFRSKLAILCFIFHSTDACIYILIGFCLPSKMLPRSLQRNYLLKQDCCVWRSTPWPNQSPSVLPTFNRSRNILPLWRPVPL